MSNFKIRLVSNGGAMQVLGLMAILHFSAIYAYNPEEYCDEFVCTKAGSFMKHAIKRKQDPCQDFYQFACGVSDGRFYMQDTESHHDRFDVLDTTEGSEIKLALERSNDRVKTIKIAREVYSQCIRFGKANDSGLSLIEDLVESVLVGGWHIGDNNNSSAIPWYKMFVEAFTSGSATSLFHISVGPNPKNSSDNIIWFGIPLSQIVDPELKQNQTQVTVTFNAYREFIEKSAKLFGDKNDTLLKLQAEEIVQLETNLTKIELSAQESRNPEKMYHKIEVKELSERTRFDWLANIIKPILVKLGNIDQDVTNRTEVIVTDLNYYIRTVEILSQLKPEIAQNYFGWKLVEYYSRFFNKNLQKFAFDFDHAIRDDGVRKLVKPEQACMNLVEDNIPLALTRLYIQLHFEKFEMEAAKKLIPEEIRESLIDYVIENEWLDEETRARSLDKLRKLRFDIAYPAWLMDTEQIDRYHGFEKDGLFLKTLEEETNFLKKLSKFRTKQIRLNLERASRPKDFVSNFDIPPHSHKVVYQPELNTITIPAGMLKFPFFDQHLPASINLASVGMLVAHEMVHAIDDRGRYFDGLGNLHDWWDEQTFQNFHNASQCFVDQYGSIVDKNVNLTLNGTLSLFENVADNIALQRSFQAYKNYDAKHKPSLKLVLVPNYDSNQIFFITYAQVWCGLMRPELERYELKHYGYAPHRYRVNVPLSNFPEFALAFNCTDGSPMNPTKKCELY